MECRKCCCMIRLFPLGVGALNHCYHAIATRLHATVEEVKSPDDISGP